MTSVIAEEYRVGVLAYRGESQAMDTWADTGEYLSKRLAPHEFVVLPYNISQMNHAVKNKTIDFVITQATHFVSMEIMYGISRIATVKRDYQDNIYTRYGAVIITRSDRDDINEISDLNDKNFAAVSKSALGGWQMAASEFYRENITLGKVDFMDFPQSTIIFAVRDGLADAGTVRARTFYELVDKGIISLLDFKIIGARTTQGYPFIHSTNLYPEWPIAKLSHTSKELSAAVVSTLLQMNKGHQAAISADVAGWTVPLDYKSIFALMQLLKIGPFEGINDERFYYRLQNIVIIVLFVLLGFLAYLLIKRRSTVVNHPSSPQLDQSGLLLRNPSQLSQQILLSFGIIDNAVMILDAQGKVSYHNRSANLLLGVEENELIGETPENIIVLTSINEASLSNNSHQSKKSLEKKSIGYYRGSNGNIFHLEVGVTPLIDKLGRILGSVMVLKDKTKLVKLEQESAYQASHDVITGLFNRREFESYLSLQLKEFEASSQDCSLLYLDLDKFKLVNNACGYVAGDALLKLVAEEIVSNTKFGEKIARMGGAEFAILLQDCKEDQAVNIAERIRTALNQLHFSWKKNIFHVSASVGVLQIEKKHKKVVEVLSNAEIASHAAKHDGGNRVHVFTKEDAILHRQFNEAQFSQELSYALNHDNFELSCQPILSLKKQKDNTEYLQILVRMRDQHNNMTQPMAFIPMAERYGQMPAVDKWVVKKTIESLLKYNIGDYNSVRCFINISGQTLSDASFLAYVRSLLSESQLNPACLCFEITETATIANFKRAVKLISELQSLGCHFALDDFGAGLSSFVYLKQLPVNYIKINGSFIRGMADDPIARAIVEAISNLCHTMNIEAIAEFVENESILSNVKSINLDYMQGNFIGKPVLFADMLKKIKTEHAGEESQET